MNTIAYEKKRNTASGARGKRALPARDAARADLVAEAEHADLGRHEVDDRRVELLARRPGVADDGGRDGRTADGVAGEDHGCCAASAAFYSAAGFLASGARGGLCLWTFGAAAKKCEPRTFQTVLKRASVVCAPACDKKPRC